MKISRDKAVIASSKLTEYLLIWRPKNDKSKFLAQAGFTIENPELLESAIRYQLETSEATMDRLDEYGEHHRVEGLLIGPDQIALEVVTIWNKKLDEELFRLVTLKPRR